MKEVKNMKTNKGRAKKMAFQPEFRMRKERDKRKDYSRKGKSRFNYNQPSGD